MPDSDNASESVPGIWSRRSTRRALLAGALTGAAAGAGALAFGLAGDGGREDSTPPGESSPAGPGTPTPAATTTPPPDGEITDPRQRAGHLLRRAGFGPTPGLVEEFAGLDREEAAARLLDFEATSTAELDRLLADRAYNIYRPGEAHRRWLTRMAHSPRQLQERMTLIWHGLLTSQLSQLGGLYAFRIKLMDSQIDLYREMALPVYDELLKAVSKNPAMMIYLNTVENEAGHPNENYARELMELFSMGEGSYGEEDVREAARAFTGWRFTRPDRPLDPDDQEELETVLEAWEPRFFVARRRHDDRDKTFLGRTGNWDGDDIIDIIMSREEPSRFIPRRLFREFVHDDPPEAEIERLAAVWDTTGHDIRELVRAILVSDEFYSRRAYRAKIRSPIEFVVGAVRGLQLDWDFRGFERAAAGMGQVPYEPPNVAGWPGGPAWLSSGTFFARANFVDLLLFHPRSPVGPGILAENDGPEEAVDRAVEALLDGDIPDASRALMVEHVATARTADERGRAAAYLALMSPEFQTV